MRRRVQTDLNINHERWLVSYADFVTLLFAFFVVMYSISQVSESKYRVLSETMTKVFNEPNRSLEPIQIGELSRSSETTPIITNNENQGAFTQTADLPQLSDQFTEQFADLIDDDVVQVNSNEYWLQISLNNSILFPLGKVDPKAEAFPVLAEVAELLRDFDNPIQVEGYTDNIRVNSTQFPSNWELSAARAAAIVKVLIDEGIDAPRLAAVGYGEHHPIAENDTPEGRAQNRRVVLMIAREKVQRPMIKSKIEVEAAIDTREREEVQVNPQPGSNSNKPLDEQASQKIPEPLVSEEISEQGTDTPQSTEEKIQALIDANKGLGLETLLREEESKKEGGAKQPDEKESSEGITPVETETGGLLFSSDPDLPRKRN